MRAFQLINLDAVQFNDHSRQFGDLDQPHMSQGSLTCLCLGSLEQMT